MARRSTRRINGRFAIAVDGSHRGGVHPWHARSNRPTPVRAAERAAGTALLRACRQQSASQRPTVCVPSADGAPRAPQPTIRALMWSNSPTIDANFKNRVKMFNEAHAGRDRGRAEFLPYDQYWQKLQLAYSSGDPYDVYFWDVQAYGHYKRDLLLNLQPMIDEPQVFDPAEYPLELFDAWRFDGENLYALPENLQTDAPLLQQDDLRRRRRRRAGRHLDLGSGGRGRKALTVRDGDRVIQWGLDARRPRRSGGACRRSPGPRATPSSTSISSRPSSSSATRPTSETLDSCRTSINTEKIAPKPIVMAQNQEPAASSPAAPRISSREAGTSPAYAECRFDWGMAPLPKWEENRVVPYWMGGWVIAKASEVAEAAFEWARWSATDYQETMATEHDWIPILNVGARVRRDGRAACRPASSSRSKR